MKRTKIVATISDKTATPEFLKKIFEEGVNVVRLNTAHQKLEDAQRLIGMIRQISDKIAIMVDTKGPEVRTQEGIEIPVKKGDTVKIVKKRSGDNTFEVNYDGFIREIKTGTKILIDDGDIGLTVVSKTDEELVCSVENDGIIKQRKSLNVPGVSLNLPSLTQKDIEFIDFSAKNDIDFIAHSFVRHKQDIIDIKKVLEKHPKCNAKIISKIENQEGVDNIDEIIDNTYGIMIARGDMGIEIPAEKVPAIQKMMIRKCIEKAVPVITATQMLHTMIENPRPTRAEVSDVANAVWDGTDSTMLSGESAYGKYQMESIQTMARIAKETESSMPSFRQRSIFNYNENLTRGFLCKAAIDSLEDLKSKNIKAIVVDTLSGATARILSSYRPNVPIYARCGNSSIVRALSLSYGVVASAVENGEGADVFISKTLNYLLDKNKITKQDYVIVISGSFQKEIANDTLRINNVETILKSL